jgi:glycosyltransferase involved in cell wall biosynthesis
MTACPLDVEIVIPVHNERTTLEGSVLLLHGFLTATFPFSWQITIVDNASTDGTLQTARRLMYELPEVVAMRVPANNGRRRALRTAWSVSRAEVLAYMDADLSADLNALLPLVAPLMSGHSDVSIGTRFKAIRADAAARLLPLVQEDESFFDTELLVRLLRDRPSGRDHRPLPSARRPVLAP